MVKTTHAATTARQAKRQRLTVRRAVGSAAQFKRGIHKPGAAAARGVWTHATSLARQAATLITAALPTTACVVLQGLLISFYKQRRKSCATSVKLATLPRNRERI